MSAEEAVRGAGGEGVAMEGEDALLDSLVRTATQAPTSRSTPRERKRSRHADRKSCEYNIVHSYGLAWCTAERQ